MTDGMRAEMVIATGDPQGVGPEVSVRAALRCAARNRDDTWTLVGDPRDLEPWWDGEPPRAADDTGPPGGLRLLAVHRSMPLDRPPPSEAGGRASLAVLEAAFDRVRKSPTTRALVTAPLSKEAVSRAGPEFLGHTGWLAERCGVKDPVMLFAAPGMRVALATVHIPLRAVGDQVTVDGLCRTLEVLHGGLARHYRIEKPRIAVLAINPHAGEGGLLGDEEIRVLRPALARFGRDHPGVAEGPFSADGFFRPGALDAWDAVLAMYHDQGLLPVKALAFGQAVNVTLGLPLVRTSVDHGCAYTIAGLGTAEWGSMESALLHARELLIGP
jgi:4-hydroxythreonine-4-phosphate dehydrogenase